MNRFIGTILLAVCVWLMPNQSSAQITYELEIDSIAALPDSIEDGMEVTFFVTVSMNTPLFYQGNIYVELEYAGNFFEADSSISANGFLGPNSPTTIQATQAAELSEEYAKLGFSTEEIMLWWYSETVPTPNNMW